MKLPELEAELLDMSDLMAEMRVDLVRMIDANRILLEALMRFSSFEKAISPGMADSVVIRCEVTAGDIREMMKALVEK